ncbi:hypothetical protein PGTUg99_037753 [Puccinia graminis f. sp. tritici]|uniref:Uncharacterized protein n=1 Tax=Puccinia graminis f. sp. tritici TaxID=56615 RepID=A0A5B0SMZ5_PUCGR|nr:hypothetical protein PGTUg99_037753 [Puccinia graminis f. sp. tritici]
MSLLFRRPGCFVVLFSTCIGNRDKKEDEIFFRGVDREECEERWDKCWCLKGRNKARRDYIAVTWLFAIDEGLCGAAHSLNAIELGGASEQTKTASTLTGKLRPLLSASQQYLVEHGTCSRLATFHNGHDGSLASRVSSCEQAWIKFSLHQFSS